jgi:hypothetical protein
VEPPRRQKRVWVLLLPLHRAPVRQEQDAGWKVGAGAREVCVGVSVCENGGSLYTRERRAVAHAREKKGGAGEREKKNQNKNKVCVCGAFVFVPNKKERRVWNWVHR